MVQITRIIIAMSMAAISTYAQEMNCYSRELWSAEKKEFCCRTKQLGCPQEPMPSSTRAETENQDMNCDSRELWSAEKKEFCCRTKQLGCPQAPMELLPSSTRAETENPNYCYTRDLWSDEKREFCCRSKNMGCDVSTSVRSLPLDRTGSTEITGQDNTPSTMEQRPWLPQTSHDCRSRERWSSEKIDWCCKYNGICIGPPSDQLPVILHNCYSKELWSNQKKEYCCAAKNIGCPQDAKTSVSVVEKMTPTSTAAPLHNCNTKEVWSTEKKVYCCATTGFGCVIKQPVTVQPAVEISSRSGEAVEDDEEAEAEEDEDEEEEAAAPTKNKPTNAKLLSLNKATSNTLSLIWATTDISCSETEFTVTYTPMFEGEYLKDQQLSIVTTTTYTTIKNLLPGVKYHVSVSASNSATASKKMIKSTEKIFQTKSSGKPKRRQAGRRL